MLTTVMFDLDGTLLPLKQDNFVKIYFKELGDKLAPLGYEREQVWKSVWAGTGAMIKNDGSRLNSEAFWKTFRALNAGKPEAKALCDRFYTEEFDRVRACLEYIPDRAPVIKELKNAGLKVILATNPIFPLSGVVTRMKWVNLCETDFDLITHYDNSTFCKPNTKYYEEILAKIGEKPENCLMVGNSPAEDMIAAKIGIKVFYVPEFAENTDGADCEGLPQGTPEDAAAYAVKLLI